MRLFAFPHPEQGARAVRKVPPQRGGGFSAPSPAELCGGPPAASPSIGRPSASALAIWPSARRRIAASGAGPASRRHPSSAHCARHSRAPSPSSVSSPGGGTLCRRQPGGHPASVVEPGGGPGCQRQPVPARRRPGASAAAVPRRRPPVARHSPSWRPSLSIFVMLSSWCFCVGTTIRLRRRRGVGPALLPGTPRASLASSDSRQGGPGRVTSGFPDFRIGRSAASQNAGMTKGEGVTPAPFPSPRPPSLRSKRQAAGGPGPLATRGEAVG